LVLPVVLLKQRGGILQRLDIRKERGEEEEKKRKRLEWGWCFHSSALGCVSCRGVRHSHEGDKCEVLAAEAIMIITVW
jgi:hypothetical protein